MKSWIDCIRNYSFVFDTDVVHSNVGRLFHELYEVITAITTDPDFLEHQPAHIIREVTRDMYGLYTYVDCVTRLGCLDPREMRSALASLPVTASMSGCFSANELLNLFQMITTNLKTLTYRMTGESEGDDIWNDD